MKNQPKLLIILGIIAACLIFGFLWTSSKSGKQQTNKAIQKKNAHQTFDVASGDTNNEVLKSIVARQQKLQEENEKLQQENKDLLNKNKRKKQEEIMQVQNTLQSKIASVKKSLESRFDHRLKDVEKQSKRNSHSSKYDINNEAQQQKKRGGIITDSPDLSEMASPTISGDNKMDGRGVDDHSTRRKDRASSSNGNAPVLPSNKTGKDDNLKNYYTVPDGSTLANVSLMSPLIGEVPVNGHLVSPAFPFKAIISRKDTEDMFSANGIPLPENISGTVLQGYSVGSMSLGCARAYVMKILFVFNDGHYIVFPANKDGKNNATQVYPSDAIGYLSNPFNNACIKGRYITDAPQVIASFMALGAGEGAGAAIAQAQTETYTSFSQATTGSVFNGNLGKYAAGLGVNEGAKEALRWYKARVGDIFDAIFVPSTLNGHPRRLVLNITRTISIDLNQNGRKLNDADQSFMPATDTSFE